MMRTDRLTTVVAVVLLAALAGCADGPSGTAASSGTSAVISSSSAASLAGSPQTPAGSEVCTGDPGATRLSLTEADNGARRCLSADGVVELYLHGTANDRWSPVEVTGTGLRVAPTGKGSLPIGVTAGFFAGTGPGEARLSAFRSPCATADSAAPGCDAVHLIRITIVVH